MSSGSRDGRSRRTAADGEAYKAQFVAGYNERGIERIKLFISGNCCVAVKGGNKLIISGTPYEFQFPADLGGGVRCSEATGYSEDAYRFYRVPQLSMAQTFAERPACVTNHNPGLYFRLPPPDPEKADARASILFGLYDYEVDPGDGWQAASLGDMQKYKKIFVDFYNKQGGLPVVKTFQSGNCCIALQGGSKHDHRETYEDGSTYEAGASLGCACDALSC